MEQHVPCDYGNTTCYDLENIILVTATIDLTLFCTLFVSPTVTPRTKSGGPEQVQIYDCVLFHMDAATSVYSTPAK